MALFTQRPLFYNSAPEPNFSGLFRLIDDFDKYSSNNQDGNSHRAARHVQTFNPKFDMKETESTFELHGELPGIEKEQVHIEVTDPQTIVVQGKVERSYTAGTAPDAINDSAADEPVVVDHEMSDTASHKSLQATVEDDPEETSSTGTTTAENTPATTVSDTVKSEMSKLAAPKVKYWVSERSVGEFIRTFSFPSRVEADEVKASLNNGILTVTVPKAKKHENRRIAIQ